MSYFSGKVDAYNVKVITESIGILENQHSGDLYVGWMKFIF